LGWINDRSGNIEFIGNRQLPLLSSGGFFVKPANKDLTLIQNPRCGVSLSPSQFGTVLTQGRRSVIRRTFIAMTAAATMMTTAAFAGGHSKDIVDTAVGAGNFTTLVAAVQAAGLVDTLKGEGPFTVFAPTDEAFAALPAGTVEDLLKPENKDKLVSILSYHVVAGKVMSTDLTEGMMATTVQGADATITLEGGAKVNGANITTADIEASNGVIHVIDAVIMPPM
jgi:uncharacterized surface protein with fasciclin (FAS1) repeats